MDNDELRQEIEQRTGVPAALLTGETSKEIITRAKTLLEYKKEGEPERPKSKLEQFAECMDELQGIEPVDEATAALDEIRRSIAPYPEIHDAGEVDPSRLPDPRSAKEQFAEWFSNKTAFDPTKGPGGWKRMP